MKKWIVKAVIQKTISYMPFKERINYFFQKHVTKGVYLTKEYFELKLRHAYDHLNYYDKYSGKQGGSVLELGTGWHPVIPISFFLAGFDKIASIDLYPWLRKQNVIESIEMFIHYRDNNKFKGIQKYFKEANWKQLEEIAANKESIGQDEILKMLKFNYLVTDARKTGFEDNSFDLICSNNTFEHIYPEILKDILKEFKRLIKKGGVMSHFIDMSDHFANIDPTISRYNFLKYSNGRWKLIDNDIQPQNRLRYPEYFELYKIENIPVSESAQLKAEPNALTGIEIHDDLKKFTKEEIAILEGYIISKMN